MTREIEELKARIAELQKNASEPRSVNDET